jgi:hypothetical protein
VQSGNDLPSHACTIVMSHACIVVMNGKAAGQSDGEFDDVDGHAVSEGYAVWW